MVSFNTTRRVTLTRVPEGSGCFTGTLPTIVVMPNTPRAREFARNANFELNARDHAKDVRSTGILSRNYWMSGVISSTMSVTQDKGSLDLSRVDGLLTGIGKSNGQVLSYGYDKATDEYKTLGWLTKITYANAAEVNIEYVRAASIHTNKERREKAKDSKKREEARREVEDIKKRTGRPNWLDCKDLRGANW